VFGKKGDRLTRKGGGGKGPLCCNGGKNQKKKEGKVGIIRGNGKKRMAVPCGSGGQRGGGTGEKKKKFPKESPTRTWSGAFFSTGRRGKRDTLSS